MPWSFDDILGQHEATTRFRREFALGRLAHAYMLEGARGVGKTTFAHALAARRLCMNPDTAAENACGACKSCRMLANNAHPDYLELPREPAELRLGRFVERSGGEPINHEPLLPFLRLRPVEGEWRVAVIPDAERMRPEAANAFLKTLEEPPGNALIILTVNARDRLPATVASRCRRIGIAPLAPDTLAGELEKRGIASGNDALDLALAAEGSLGTARELSGGDTVELWRRLSTDVFENPGALAARKFADLLQNYGGGENDNAGKRKNALAALDLAALALRRKMRHGLEPNRAETALAALWTAADQIVKNIRPDLALLSAAFEVMAALRK